MIVDTVISLSQLHGVTFRVDTIEDESYSTYTFSEETAEKKTVMRITTPFPDEGEADGMCHSEPDFPIGKIPQYVVNCFLENAPFVKSITDCMRIMQEKISKAPLN